MKYKNAVILALILATVSPAYGASDGSLGPTSTGSLSVSITIPEKILITKVDNIDLADFTGSGSRNGSDDVCIYTNNPGGTYKITATGDGTGGAFTIRDGASNAIAYRVKWNDQTGTTGNVEVTTGTELTGQTGADTNAENCTGSNNANVEVIVDESQMTAAEAGTYTGNLALLVEPN